MEPKLATAEAFVFFVFVQCFFGGFFCSFFFFWVVSVGFWVVSVPKKAFFFPHFVQTGFIFLLNDFDSFSPFQLSG